MYAYPLTSDMARIPLLLSIPHLSAALASADLSKYVTVYAEMNHWIDEPTQRAASQGMLACSSFAREHGAGLTFYLTPEACSVPVTTRWYTSPIRLHPGFPGFTTKLHVPQHRIFWRTCMILRAFEFSRQSRICSDS